MFMARILKSQPCTVYTVYTPSSYSKVVNCDLRIGIFSCGVKIRPMYSTKVPVVHSSLRVNTCVSHRPCSQRERPGSGRCCPLVRRWTSSWSAAVGRSVGNARVTRPTCSSTAPPHAPAPTPTRRSTTRRCSASVRATLGRASARAIQPSCSRRAAPSVRPGRSSTASRWTLTPDASAGPSSANARESARQCRARATLHARCTSGARRAT